MSLYDQGSQLQSPALTCNISRRAIKYLEWKALALTKNTSTLAGLTGSANIWQPYKPAPERDTTANQRVFHKPTIQGKVPTSVSCRGPEFKFPHWSVLGKRREAAYFFPPSFCVQLEMGPGGTDLLVKTSPLISLVNSKSLWLKPRSPVHPN